MPRQYFFWKYLNTIIVLYCIIVQKSPNFVQLSPIQCTYSNIFIRFFKFFPANTNIYQNSYRVIGALCGLRQGVLSLRAYHGTLIVLRATHFMSLRGAMQRGNLPEGNPCYKTHARYFCTCVEKKGANKHKWALPPPTMRFQKRSVRRRTCTFPLFSTYTVFTLEAWFCLTVCF